MKVLVTGGAGYIGSFMVKRLLEKEAEVVVIDSLEKGYRDAVDPRATFYEGKIQDQVFLNKVFSENTFDAVIHFAGYISMGESMENPRIYFENNTQASLNLIDISSRNKIKSFILSSTAGVYGNPIEIPIPETHPTNPTNPYGESKLMVEKILTWYKKIFNLSSASLRYFNASGGSLDGSLGEGHDPETHLIPNLMLSALNNKKFKLFGTDYPTPDGTCIRDYIHVIDLVEAHVLVMDKLLAEGGVHTYNVGTGKGYSNKEIISKVKEITRIDIDIEELPKRPGDADSLIADSNRIKNEIGFQPKYSDLDTIIKTAWEWHNRDVKKD